MEEDRKMNALLDEWYIQMREQNDDAAEKLKDKVEERIRTIKDPNVQIKYKLMQIRYCLLTGDYSQVLQIYSDLGPIQNIPEELRYYYVFFNGLLMFENNKYREALEIYNESKPYLEKLADRRETAEFKYKYGFVHHRLNNTALSLKEIMDALELFKQENNIKRIISCENLLAMNKTFISQYQEAEHHYQNAKRLAENLNHRKKKSMIYLNLGYLYHLQGLNYSAIKYLEKAHFLMKPSDHDWNEKNLYLLSKEYFRQGQKKSACKLLDDGVKLCMDGKNEEYIYHFQMLKSKYDSNQNQMEEVYLQGLDYFKSEELWEYVVEYSEELALRFRDMERFQEAVIYYDLAREAQEKIRKKGEIKQ